MELKDCRIGFGITGSFCTFSKITDELKTLSEKAHCITPVFSDNVQRMNTRFGNAREFIEQIEMITGNKGIKTITAAETVGPNALFDVMVIAPCTGNTLAKLCNGITDTPVLMAAKAHLRNNRPLVISISTNDALGANFKNIGLAMNMKNVYFVPFIQDDIVKKPNSLVADVSLIDDTITAALSGRQIQPLIGTAKAKE